QGWVLRPNGRRKHFIGGKFLAAFVADPYRLRSTTFRAAELGSGLIDGPHCPSTLRARSDARVSSGGAPVLLNPLRWPHADTVLPNDSAALIQCVIHTPREVRRLARRPLLPAPGPAHRSVASREKSPPHQRSATGSACCRLAHRRVPVAVNRTTSTI